MQEAGEGIFRKIEEKIAPKRAEKRRLHKLEQKARESIHFKRLQERAAELKELGVDLSQGITKDDLRIRDVYDLVTLY